MKVCTCKRCGLEFQPVNRKRVLCNKCTQSQPFESRFWLKVRIGDVAKCWEWTASLDDRGYGQVNVGGKNKRAHRVVWELTRGEIPKDKFLCHKCDNKKCVNPDHLFLGSPKDNIVDMDKKNRRVNTPHLGEKHGMAKLNNNQVKTIKTMLAHGRFTQRQIAKMFHIGFGTVNHIKMGRQWRSV